MKDTGTSPWTIVGLIVVLYLVMHLCIIPFAGFVLTAIVYEPAETPEPVDYTFKTFYQDCGGELSNANIITDGRYGGGTVDATSLPHGCTLVYTNKTDYTMFLYPLDWGVMGSEKPEFTIVSFDAIFCEGVDGKGVFIAQPGCQIRFSKFRWIEQTTIYPYPH